MQVSPESLSATRLVDMEYLELCGALWRAAVDDQIAGLAPDKRAAVTAACTDLGLTDEATRSALATTCDLIDFERYGRHYVLTPAQRFETLKFIRDAAHGLAEAIGDLPPNDRLALNSAFRAVRGGLKEHQRLKLELSMVPDALAFYSMAHAAQRLIEARSNEEGKGGRRPLRAEYSRFIATLAYEFEESGLPVGRGGAFERLCTVVFEAAGVRANPEGAIRYYLTERKKRTTTGPENSSNERAE